MNDEKQTNQATDSNTESTSGKGIPVNYDVVASAICKEEYIRASTVLNLIRDGVIPMDGDAISIEIEGMKGWALISAEQIKARQDRLNAQKAAAVVPVTSGFVFGKKSQANLIGVRPELQSLAKLALQLSKQDFMVFDGVRTQADQMANVKAGTSHTMLSKHLNGDAVDLVPVLGTIPKWDWVMIFPVVLAVYEAATHLGFADKIIWGGAWDKHLSDFTSHTDFQQVIAEYEARHPGKDFIDGPHFEWNLGRNA